MEDYIIAAEFKNPAVTFIANTGTFNIEGKSIPERTEEFYEPILSWIDEYFQDPPEETTLDLKLEYCNSASTRYVLDILERFEVQHKKGVKVTVNWYYEEDDEDMLDLGESYRQPLELQINIITIPV